LCRLTDNSQLSIEAPIGLDLINGDSTPGWTEPDSQDVTTHNPNALIRIDRSPL